ncbi:HTH-type transcriptional activator IlvY [Oceanobacter mangrovi]|uniref:HTH-type transcriptional activator IlvY n=1 Tax=Oceanobacter mangrovi TaxID=2862510 RepID=UPI001C8DE26E|nr:HTH-type transcriptional activator IlvY [Oceanobacter mangrovi]
MEYKDLQAFITLSSTLHLGRAAELLHMSASTLSRRLARMEEEIGATLMSRDSSPLELTIAGERFRRHAEQTLFDWQTLRNEVKTGVSDLAGQLTLFCSVTASFTVLPDLLSRFREQYPNVDLNILTGDAAESIPRLASSDADLVVAARPETLEQGLTFRALTSSPLLFIAPRNMAVIPALTKGEPDWPNVPMVLSSTGLARSRVEQWFADKQLKPHIYAQVSGNEAIVSMVSLGVGVGVVPELVLRNSPVASRVRVMSVQPELEPFLIGLCCHSHRLQEPLIQALWKTAFDG